MPAATVIKIIFAKLSGQSALLEGMDSVFPIVVLDVRLPRILSAAIVGAGLAISGVVFQGILLNPLADPYTLGVSAGAAFGASLAILLNIGLLGTYSIPLFAFIGAAVTLMFVIYLSSSSGGLSSNNLILSGIIVAAILSAGISFLKYVADEQVAVIIFWLMGSFGSKTWSKCRPYFRIYFNRLFSLHVLCTRYESDVVRKTNGILTGRGYEESNHHPSGDGLTGCGDLRVGVGHNRFRGAFSSSYDEIGYRTG